MMHAIWPPTCISCLLPLPPLPPAAAGTGANADADAGSNVASKCALLSDDVKIR